MSGGAQTASSWIPTWLTQELNFDLKQAGVLSMLPQLASFIVVVVTGPLALALLERRLLSVTALRKICQGCGLLVPAALLLMLCQLQDVTRTGALALIIASVAFGGLTYSGHHVNHIDIAPTYAPILYGTTNTVRSYYLGRSSMLQRLLARQPAYY
jgi:hypothetical protein